MEPGFARKERDGLRNQAWVLKKYVSRTSFPAASAAAKFFFSLFG
jgi:hypothetical protein